MKSFGCFLSICLIAGCCSCGRGPAAGLQNSTTNVPAQRSYNGTASVGDFLVISLDSTAHTLTYTNKSNGDAGTVPYTVSSDGTYTFSDPTHNLVSGYEVPGVALLIQALKTGPNHNTPALITAVQTGTITKASFASKKYNYMQFRTNSGGVEVGSANIDASTNINVSGYWPYGASNPGNQSGSPFNSGMFPGTNLQQDSSSTFLTLTEDGSTDYIFGTPSGVFAVDTPNGAILGFPVASTKTFDSTAAGTYHAFYYQKLGASTGYGNVETGTPSLVNATITISSVGAVTVTDAQGAVVAQGTLTPIADTSYLQGAGKLADACYGFFTFRVSSSNSQRDVFIAFSSGALLFSSFHYDPTAPGGTYDYFYGVGLK